MDTLPLERDLTLAYRTSLLVALLTVVVPAAGLAWGTTLYGVDPNHALRVSASTAGVLVPGFLVQDIFNLVVGVPILVGVLWLARRGSPIRPLPLAGAALWLALPAPPR